MNITIDQIVNKYLNKVGENVKENAKENAPVDTGALRDSIEKRVAGKSVFVETDIPYAIFMELGTRFLAPRAFLRRALYNRTNYKG